VVDVEHQHGHAGDSAGGHVQPSAEEHRNRDILHRSAGSSSSSSVCSLTSYSHIQVRYLASASTCRPVCLLQPIECNQRLIRAVL
jgi:hypothetical protein